MKEQHKSIKQQLLTNDHDQQDRKTDIDLLEKIAEKDKIILQMANESVEEQVKLISNQLKEKTDQIVALTQTQNDLQLKLTELSELSNYNTEEREK